MNLLEHYYIIALGAFSNKLGDLVFLFVSVLWNFLIWEIRTYHSSNTSKKSESERILSKITQNYWFCTNYRIHFNTELVPTGFIIGRNFFLARIDIKQNDVSNNTQRTTSCSQSFVIHLYGWWSIQTILTYDIVTHKENGNYKIVLPSNDYTQSFIKSYDYFNNDFFHKNCRVGAEMILSDYEKRDKLGGVYFLSGNPGLGKTTTARLIANKLNAWLCLDLEEYLNHNTTMVYSFEMLYNYIQPDEVNPLVIVLDEVDHFLFYKKNGNEDDDDDKEKQSKQKTDKKEQYCLRQRSLKKNWSRLLDSIQQKKYVLFLLTTNRDKEFFDAVDDALLRKYRVSQCYQYLKNGVKITKSKT